jgi:hypothetical protein
MSQFSLEPVAPRWVFRTPIEDAFGVGVVGAALFGHEGDAPATEGQSGHRKRDVSWRRCSQKVGEHREPFADLRGLVVDHVQCTVGGGFECGHDGVCGIVDVSEGECTGALFNDRHFAVLNLVDG